MLLRKQSGARWFWIVISEVAALAVLAAPSIAFRQAPPTLVFVQILIVAILLGAGRQGIDLLAVRTLALFAALAAVTEVDHTAVNHYTCSGVADCARNGVIFFVGILLASVIVALFVLLVSLIWNRTWRALTPEIEWRRVQPKTARQWIVVLAASFVVLTAGYLLLAIPTY